MGEPGHTFEPVDPPPGLGPTRLDLWLTRALGVSRGAARRLLAAGHVRRNGRACSLRDKAAIVGPSDRVEAVRQGGAAGPLAEPDAPLAVLAEGAGWIAVDKPAGSPVHPLRPDERGTVLNALVARRPSVLGIGDAHESMLRSGVVHRLDVPTSGALLFATDQPTWQRLRDAFASHTIHKRYLALVHGSPPTQGELTRHLVVAQHSPAKVRVADDAGVRQARRCSLGWRVVEQREHTALLEVRLDTGFLHQIRVMLSDLGHPVVGDPLYGREGDAASRLMLHAWLLRLGDEIDVKSRPPARILLPAGGLSQLGA